LSALFIVLLVGEMVFSTSCHSSLHFGSKAIIARWRQR